MQRAGQEVGSVIAHPGGFGEGKDDCFDVKESLMRAKSLTKNEAEQVAKKAVEIVQSLGGGFVKGGTLLDRLFEIMPEFKGHSLWKGIDYATENGLLEWVKYKGYRLAPQVQAVTIPPEASHLHPTLSRDDGKESYYYPFVANWFVAKGNCITAFKKGREWGMPDVSVVRTSSSELVDEIELITIEVKRGGANISSLTQAYGYSKLAHRCYLAADEIDELQKLKEHAERVGIGLLSINPKDPSDITELLSPPRSEPSQVSLQEHLARAFDLVHCALCGIWFKRVWGSKKEAVQGTKMLKRNRGGLVNRCVNVRQRQIPLPV